MESALILEGFKYLFEKNVFIKEIISDADSNTFPAIRNHYKNGVNVIKIDCANHMARNFCSYLIDWKKTYKNQEKGNTPKWRSRY